ncbi:universal stress protein [Mechercharimyces sp. CAU 1602]|uniref:universal stress protein n=1 Tax=Mechercharimyces sp. CAU 1602 TaxID=2973933 RepID=UPI0021630CCA|nr:universal stress protein [Mechercharimyces sp. CAU 1602]MCS1352730.1 universal stress protein [Mechercharimyces sp. CAU 1602]
MRKHILVPTDGSEDATLALQEAMTYAQQLDEKIILLHVQPHLTTFHTRRFFSEADIHAYEEQLSEEALAPAKEILKNANLAYEIKMRLGDPKQEILAEADTEQVRMIVVGAKGEGALLGSLLGSVTYGLVQHSPCPVMVVSHRQANK